MDQKQMAKQAYAEFEQFMGQNVTVPAFLRMCKSAGIPEPKTEEELNAMLEAAVEINNVKKAAQSGQYPELENQMGNEFDYVATMAKRASLELLGRPTTPTVPVSGEMVEKFNNFQKAAAALEAAGAAQ